MKLTDNIKTRGGILVSKNDEEPVWIPNVVCRIGRERLASHAANMATQNYWFSHLGIGCGIAEASTEDLCLADEFYRVPFDNVWAVNYTVFGAVTITGVMIDAYCDIVLGLGTYAITEFGLLDALSGGTLICRQRPDFQFDLQGDDALEILWGVLMC
jgi:hypothetical protein